MRYHILFLALFVGCSEASTDLTAWQKAMRDGSVDAIEATKAVEAKTDEAVVILKDNTAALARIEKSLEASLVESKSVRKEDDQQSALNPPAKANTASAPLKVATPGDSSDPETLVELATRLYAQGVNVHNRTREELEAIDCQLVGTKSTPVQYQMRASFMQPSGTVCVNGQCVVPQVSSRRGRR